MTVPLTPRGRALLREAKGALKASLPSAAWRRLRQTLAAPPRTIGLEALDEELARADAALFRSNDEGLAVLRSFQLAPQKSMPADPWSPEYRAAQLELYQRVSGRSSYSVEYERSGIDVDVANYELYPYVTRSTTEVGDQLIAIGYLIKHLGLAPRAEVVELGAGWGNTTCALAHMGFRVTAVDVDPAFLELIRRRVAAFDGKVTLVNADMLAFRPKQTFDGALFYESFHHCSDPLAMLARLQELVRPGGRLIFASEPIDDFAMPWGIRLDGQSLWSMRRHGWLELGFETSWFFEALRRTGWVGRRHRSHAISALTDVIVAERPARRR